MGFLPKVVEMGEVLLSGIKLYENWKKSLLLSVHYFSRSRTSFAFGEARAPADKFPPLHGQQKGGGGKARLLCFHHGSPGTGRPEQAWERVASVSFISGEQDVAVELHQGIRPK